MVLGVLAALSLGVALAYPLLVTQMPPLEKPDLGLIVVYTYISSPLNNSGLTGVWRNYSEPWQVENLIFNYMVVMNITNYSNTSVHVKTFAAMVGPNVTVTKESGWGGNNLIVNDYREPSPLAFSDSWLPYEI
jgi:hypothetical protein